MGQTTKSRLRVAGLISNQPLALTCSNNHSIYTHTNQTADQVRCHLIIWFQVLELGHEHFRVLERINSFFQCRSKEIWCSFFDSHQNVDHLENKIFIFQVRTIPSRTYSGDGCLDQGHRIEFDQTRSSDCTKQIKHSA